MGKIKYIKKARKEYKCYKCGKVIAVGEPYKRGVMNFHPDIIVCDFCPLKSYEVTTSEYSSRVGQLCEDWHDMFGYGVGASSDIASILEELRDEAEASLDSMPDNLRETSSTGELLQSRIDSLESAIDSLNDISEEQLEDDAEDEAKSNVDREDYETEEEYQDALEEYSQGVYEENLSNAIDEALANLEY